MKVIMIPSYHFQNTVLKFLISVLECFNFVHIMITCVQRY